MAVPAMPPRARQRVVPHDAASLVLPPLPASFVNAVLELLTYKERFCCARVSRAFRAALRDASVWQNVDLTNCHAAGMRVTSRLLRVLSDKAAGKMATLACVVGVAKTMLDDSVSLLSPTAEDPCALSISAVASAVVDNGEGLRRLVVRCAPLSECDASAGVPFSPLADIHALLAAAPGLLTCEADVACSSSEASLIFARAGRYKPLRLRRLIVNQWEGPASVEALSLGVARHGHVKELVLESAPLQTPCAWAAVVRAALSSKLTALCFTNFHCGPAAVPGLAAALGGGALTHLSISNDRKLFDSPRAAAFCFAVLACPGLASLGLVDVGLWDAVDVGVSIVDSLVGHVGLAHCCLAWNKIRVDAEVSAGAALARLVGADSGALETLDISLCDAGEVGLRPLFRALKGNTRLRALCVRSNGMTPAFAKGVVLPAVRHNKSLRVFRGAFANDDPVMPSLLEAEGHVATRRVMPLRPS